MSIVILTGARAPYTHLLYEALGQASSEAVHVLTCTEREATRRWHIPPARAYRHEVLPGLRLTRSLTSTVYLNPAVVWRLVALAPRLLIVNDFSPTSLLAALTARWLGIPVGVRTDGAPATDPGARSAPHRWLRRAIISRCGFGIAPSEASAALLRAYGLAPDCIIRTHLFPGWRPAQATATFDERSYDVLFCGTLDEPVKGALFFADVIVRLARRGRRLAVRIAGDGPARREMERRLAEGGVAAHCDGFVDQAGLEAIYRSARLFAFPSRGDVWGLAVNEAMQCGTPVLSSPHATVAHELLAPAGAGAVAPLAEGTWADQIAALLDDRAAWQTMQTNGLAAVGPLGPAAAVDDYRRAIARFAAARGHLRPSPAQPG